MTGSGKTTLIDSMLNYLLGVEFFDKFRYKLVDERKHLSKNKGTQLFSMTSETTVYHIPYEWIKQGHFSDDQFCINIIDTPGYGDTSGYKQDMRIFSMITNTFKNLQTIDYICLVNKASDNRLVASVKMVYEKIQDMFGKDVIDRFVVMCTFSDGKEPLAR